MKSDSGERAPKLSDKFSDADWEKYCAIVPTALPAQPPDEALGADEAARQTARRIANLYNAASNTPSGELEVCCAEIIVSAIHAAEQRVRREDAEIARTTFDNKWETGYRNAGIMIGSAILARLGEPERKE